jgi:hypothetical protein
MPFEEGQNFLADLHRVRFPGKVAGVIENHLRLGVVALLSLTPGGIKKGRFSTDRKCGG